MQDGARVRVSGREKAGGGRWSRRLTFHGDFPAACQVSLVAHQDDGDSGERDPWSPWVGELVGPTPLGPARYLGPLSVPPFTSGIHLVRI